MNTPTLRSPSARRNAWLALGAAAMLAGCAAFQTFTGEVSSYGAWPAGRAPGTFAFDRLPSQQADMNDQKPLEEAAQAALQAAGFTPVAAGGTPDVMVQIGARISAQVRSPWDDPLWWHGGYGRWNWPRWGGPAWGWHAELSSPSYAREVAVLIRDRASGQPLYEAHAHSDGASPGGKTVINAMFAIALKEFPATRPEPHDVSVSLP